MRQPTVFAAALGLCSVSMAAGSAHGSAGSEKSVTAPADRPEAAAADPEERGLREPITADDVRAAPLPGETGAPAREPESSARAVGRVVLWPLRGLWWVVATPLRLSADLIDDRREARGPWTHGKLSRTTFWSDAIVSPAARVNTDFGLGMGLSIGHRDLLGAGESVRIFGAALGRQLYAARLEASSGNRLGPLELHVRGRAFHRDEEYFFGVGHDAEGDSRFEHRVRSGSAGATLDVAEPVQLSLGVRHADTDFPDAAEADRLAEHGGAALPGYPGGYRKSEAVAALALDTTESTPVYLGRAYPTRGLRGTARVAAVALSEIAPSPRFWRFEAELSILLPIAREDRILTIGQRIAHVTGSADQLPFTELPAIGGRDSLAGFQQDRFRGQTAALTVLDYRFPLNAFLSARTFVTMGRVYGDVDVAELGDQRFGGGIGLALGRDDRVARTTVEVSDRGRVAWLLQLGWL